MPVINIQSLHTNKNFETEVCIIGAGMSGQVIASKINKKKIFIIDSGKINYDANIQELNNFQSVGFKFRENHVNRIRQISI